MYKTIVGLDGDLHKSGLAVWDLENKIWLYAKATPNENIVEVLALHCDPNTTLVKLEAGWKIKKANLRGGNYLSAQRKAKNVGENHAAGKMIEKILIKAGYTVELVSPLAKGPFKSLKGSWSVLGRQYITKRTGITKGINDDTRDAIFLTLHDNNYNGNNP